MSTEMKSKKRQIAFAIIIILGFLGLFVLDVLQVNKSFKNQTSGYAALERKDSINDEILAIKSFENLKYSSTVVYVTLHSRAKYKVHCKINPEYSNQGIHDIAKTGDRIVKERWSDTVRLIRSNNQDRDEYFFIINDAES